MSGLFEILGGEPDKVYWCISVSTLVGCSMRHTEQDYIFQAQRTSYTSTDWLLITAPPMKIGSLSLTSPMVISTETLVLRDGVPLSLTESVRGQKPTSSLSNAASVRTPPFTPSMANTSSGRNIALFNGRNTWVNVLSLITVVTSPKATSYLQIVAAELPLKFTAWWLSRTC